MEKKHRIKPITRKKDKQVFDHHVVAKILILLGFNRIGDKSNAFATYMNPRSNVVSYYVNKTYTPIKKSAYIFVYKDKKEYAYNIDDFKSTYESLIKTV